MRPMSKADRLYELIRLLDVEHRNFRGSDAVRDALGGPARLYIETWVLPVLVELHDSERRRLNSRRGGKPYRGAKR